MAHLAEQVLLWLPVSRISKLGPERSRKVLAARQEIVPLPPEEVLAKLRKITGLKTENPQLWLALLCGEIIQPLASKLDPRFLLKRALRLRDHQTCRQVLAVALSEPLPRTFWEILLAGDPETVRLALTRRMDYDAIIPDPAAIPWSPELVQLVSTHLQSRNWLGRSSARGYTVLAGHLQLAPLQVVAQSRVDWVVYASAFVRSRELQLPGYQPKFTREEIIVLQSRLPAPFLETGLDPWLASLGCQGLTRPLSENLGAAVASAVIYCQPRVLELLLAAGGQTWGDYDVPNFLAQPEVTGISPLQVAAAREMLRLARRYKLQLGAFYLTALQIVCGEKVNPELVSSKILLESLMVLVAHPQLEQKMAVKYWNLDISCSCVHYDLPKLFYFLPERPVDAKDLALVYANGQLVPVLLQEKSQLFQEAARHLFPS